MENIKNFLEDKFIPIAIKFGNQRHLRAIRDGIVSTIPLTVIGGISLLIASPPVNPNLVKSKNIFINFLLEWYSWANINQEKIITVFNMTMAIMAVFVAISVAYSLAKIYYSEYEEELEPLSSAIVSGVVFLMVAAPAKDSMIPMKFLDAKGLFTAMLIGLFTVEISRFLIKKNITIKMPKGVPPAVSASFSSLIPMIVNIIIFYSINLLLISKAGTIAPEFIIKILTPAIEGADTIGFVIIMMLISHILWLFGVHGGATTSAIVSVVQLNNITANAAAKLASKPMPYIYTNPLSVSVIVMGGAGATLGLTFLLLRSKSPHLRTVGKVGILSGMFGINEPVLFGMPIILNPTLAVPFILTPIVNTIIGFYSVKAGLVGKAYIAVPWTTPPFINLPLATMDWRAFILVLVVFFIDMIIYYPFFKVYEKILIEKEN